MYKFKELASTNHIQYGRTKKRLFFRECLNAIKK